MRMAQPYPTPFVPQRPNVLSQGGHVLASATGNRACPARAPHVEEGPMRLSGWRARAPSKDAVAPKVLAVVEAAMSTLGAEPDPECWIAWGDDPAVRYLVLAPTPGGLIQANV